MKTIGELKTDEEGTRTTGEVVRVTKGTLGGAFGADRARRLVVELRDGDVLIVRPHRCHNGAVQVLLRDVYRWGLWMQASRRQLEKARARKARLAELRARRALERAERRLTQESEP